MPTKITIENKSSLPMVFLMNRLALLLMRPGALETSLEEFVQERCALSHMISARVFRRDGDTGFLIQGFDTPDPSRPTQVEIRNSTMAPDSYILQDAAKLYEKHQENFLLGCDATDYSKDESTKVVSRTIYLDNTMRNGAVTISFYDQLESSLSMALDALKKQTTDWKEIPQAIEDIEAIYRKAKDVPCRQADPVAQEPVRKPLASVGDIVSFRQESGFSSLMKVKAIAAGTMTGAFIYTCSFYYPTVGHCDETTSDRWESDLHVIYDQNHINECRETLNAIRKLIPHDDVTTSSSVMNMSGGARCPSGMHISITTQYKRTEVDKGEAE